MCAGSRQILIPVKTPGPLILLGLCVGVALSATRTNKSTLGSAALTDFPRIYGLMRLFTTDGTDGPSNMKSYREMSFYGMILLPLAPCAISPGYPNYLSSG